MQFCLFLGVIMQTYGKQITSVAFVLDISWKEVE